MKSFQYIELLTNQLVMNPKYGLGRIEKIKIVDLDLMVTIVFEKDQNLECKKTFLSKIAFSNGYLEFKNPENLIIYKDLINSLNEHRTYYVEKNLNTNITIDKKENEMSKIKFDSAINLLVNKIINENNIALDLISFFNDEQFENDLFLLGFQTLLEIIRGEHKGNKQKYSIIILLLSYISLKYYDGDLHSHVEELFRQHFRDSHQQYNKKHIIKAIYDALEWYKPKVLYFDSKSYNAVPIILSCVPHYRMDDLFRFSFDIYKKKMLYDEELSDSQIYDKVLETLKTLKRKDLIGNNDSIKIKGSEYLMSKFTQSCIASGKCIEDLSGIISYCIRLIINSLTRHEDSFIVPEYYKNGYSSFVEYFKSNHKERERYESKRSISRPYFQFLDNKLHLVTGELGFEDSYDINKLELIIYSNEEEVKRISLNVIGSIEINEDDDIGGYKLNRRKILLDCNVLNNFSYSIVCGATELYNSKQKLHRKNLFFDGKGNEVKAGTEYNGTLRVITSSSHIELYGSDIKEQKFNNDLYMSFVDVNNRDVFRFDDESYIFYKISEPKMIGYAVPWAEYISFDDKKYEIYKDMSVIFQAPCESEDLIIDVNGIKNSIYEMDDNINYDVILFSRDSNGVNAYQIKFKKIPEGYNNIRIFNSKTNKLVKHCSFEFLYDSFLEKRFISFDEKGVLYNFDSSMIKDSFEYYYEYGSFKDSFECFAKGLGHGTLNVYPSVISYSFDGIVWKDIFEKIYLRDLPLSQKSIFICGPDNLITYHYDKKNHEIKQLTLVQDEQNKCLYKFDIDCFRKSEFEDERVIDAIFEFSKRQKRLVIKLTRYVSAQDSKIYFDEETRTHNFYIVFKGTGKIKCIIQDINGEIVLYDGEISSNQNISIIDSMIPDEVKFLKVSLYEKKGGGIFSKYNEKAFYIFPKYSISKYNVELVKSPYFSYLNEKRMISFVASFDKVDYLKMRICPSGFNEILFEKEIESNEKVEFYLNELFFDSYNILLYAKNRSGLSYEEKPFYISPAIKTSSPYLRRKFELDVINYNDGSRKCVDYTFYCKHIVEFKGKYFLNGNIFNSITKKEIIPDALVEVLSEKDDMVEANLRRLKEDKIVRLKSKEGGTITTIILKK